MVVFKVIESFFCCMQLAEVADFNVKLNAIMSVVRLGCAQRHLRDVHLHNIAQSQPTLYVGPWLASFRNARLSLRHSQTVPTVKVFVNGVNSCEKQYRANHVGRNSADCGRKQQK